MNQKAEFENLLTPCLGGLHSVALRKTHSDSDAADLAQDVIERAWRFFDRFERGTNFRAWLMRILTNTHINRGKRVSRDHALEFVENRECVHRALFSEDARDVAASPEILTYRSLTRDAVRTAIDALPTHYRRVLILAELQELPYTEIAAQLAIPIGTVMSRLFRGRKALRALVAA